MLSGSERSCNRSVAFSREWLHNAQTQPCGCLKKPSHEPLPAAPRPRGGVRREDEVLLVMAHEKASLGNRMVAFGHYGAIRGKKQPTGCTTFLSRSACRRITPNGRQQAHSLTVRGGPRSVALSVPDIDWEWSDAAKSDVPAQTNDQREGLKSSTAHLRP